MQLIKFIVQTLVSTKYRLGLRLIGEVNYNELCLLYSFGFS